mmetsp:Transcript_125579/g.361056  ORF Transcript_125579/g.361056 Transcript_125579/m.361056 type:complete len:319 (-) Transcript_125579:304-1260(-)
MSVHLLPRFDKLAPSCELMPSVGERGLEGAAASGQASYCGADRRSILVPASQKGKLVNANPGLPPLSAAPVQAESTPCHMTTPTGRKCMRRPLRRTRAPLPVLSALARSFVAPSALTDSAARSGVPPTRNSEPMNTAPVHNENQPCQTAIPKNGRDPMHWESCACTGGGAQMHISSAASSWATSSSLVSAASVASAASPAARQLSKAVRRWRCWRRAAKAANAAARPSAAVRGFGTVLGGLDEVPQNSIKLRTLGRPTTRRLRITRFSSSLDDGPLLSNDTEFVSFSVENSDASLVESPLAPLRFLHTRPAPPTALGD